VAKSSYVVVKNVAHPKLLKGHPIANALLQELIELEMLLPGTRWQRL